MFGLDFPSVEEAEDALNKVKDFTPKTSAGMWEKPIAQQRAESTSVIAYQIASMIKGEKEIRQLRQLAGY